MLKTVVVFCVTIIYKRPKIIPVTTLLEASPNDFHEELTWSILMCISKPYLKCYSGHIARVFISYYSKNIKDEINQYPIL